MYKNKGFTLIESLVVLTIMTVTVVMGAPILNQMQAKNRVKSAANELASALKQGRSEALAQRRNLRFVALSSTWGSGWKVVNKVTAPTVATTYLEQHALPITIKISSTPVATEFEFIAATGMLTKSDGTLTDVVFKVCDTGIDKGIDVSMSRLGRIALKNHTSSAGCAL